MPEMKNVKLRMTNLHLHASGVFSNVYRQRTNKLILRGTLLSPGEVPREIAIKKTWPESRDRNFEMIFLTGISREKHKNIIQMIYAFSNKRDDRVCESFVFDFMPDTLGTLIENSSLDLVDIKLYTWQMFNGLQYLSQLHIMHRDVKPVNILVDHPQGLLKIGDFGSAKVVRPGMTSTPYQVTRFYRPPELLLGADNYNWTIDIWSAGCVLGEMVKGNVLFPGRDTKHQLKLIRRAIGSPTEADLRSMKILKPVENMVERCAGTGLGALLPSARPDIVFFLGKILIYRPRSRLCGKEVLRDPFFDSLFREGAKRANGQLISLCITSADIAEAHSIDESKVKTKLSSIIMKAKLDFSCDDESKESRELVQPPKAGSNESAEAEVKKKVRKPKHRPGKSMMLAPKSGILRRPHSAERGKKSLLRRLRNSSH
ncbi:kinase domain protein [Dictyocaulus viviparus]|uniref:Kinase domain protein n=1 Tax=Dictyocaulus viviparus TaxID=29172 RepID=A0A0D8XVQ5_DICVI|nr:kinase domain protein [Dictyocaulus viviparus]